MSSLLPRNIINYILTGWIILEIGVFQDSSGGGIEYQFGFAKKKMIIFYPLNLRRNALYAESANQNSQKTY